MGPGFGRGMGFGRGGRRGCGKRILFAHPEVLKAKLGLSDAQVQKVEALRTNVMTKMIKGRAEVQLLRLQKRRLMQADLPDTNKVLKVHRKMRSIRGRLAEERIKTHIRFLGLLSKDQRTKLRLKCAKRGWGGRGHHRRGGRGKGWGGAGDGSW